MKVRITKMRYIEGIGRVRPGEVVDWQGSLASGMVALEEAPKAPEPQTAEREPVTLSEASASKRAQRREKSQLDAEVL